LKKFVFQVPEDVIGFLNKRDPASHLYFPVHAVYKKAIQLGLRKDIKDLPPITANQL
jgi:hypothetical protein